MVALPAGTALRRTTLYGSVPHIHRLSEEILGTAPLPLKPQDAFGSMIANIGGIREPAPPAPISQPKAEKEPECRKVTDARSLTEWFQQEILAYPPMAQKDSQNSSESTSSTSETATTSREASDHVEEKRPAECRPSASLSGLDKVKGLLCSENLESLSLDNMPNLPASRHNVNMSLDNLPTMDDPPTISELGEELRHDNSNSTDEKLRIMNSHASKIPAYPIMADYKLEVGDESIEVCEHLGAELGDTRCIVIMIPGVNGGMGPCRAPGVIYDDEALYPSIARGRLSKGDTDCYRVSWQYRSPNMRYCINTVCNVVHRAVHQANKRYKANGLKPPTIRVVFVGHSLGAPVAMHAAEVMGRHYQHLKTRGQEIRVAGVVTLNGARNEPLELTTEALSNMHGLMICGLMDEVVTPIMTKHLFQIFPSTSKRFIQLPYGTHDLYAYKDVLLETLEDFIIKAAFQSKLVNGHDSVDKSSRMTTSGVRRAPRDAVA
mmetsp:Transcript_52266/g.154261  ORF Transcript_52266/g.154261 Transcript_52266/m.154261 type:complete len:492 (+) Transcript_52266:138-1613(+)